jgi:pilus assembly protein CpaB
MLGISLSVVAFLLTLILGFLLAGGAQGGQQVSIVVAARDIRAREAIKAADLTTVHYPLASLPPGAMASVTQASGSYARVGIVKGQPLTSNLVAKSSTDLPPKDAPSYLPIPPGLVAVSIPTNELQGVGGYIAAGDHINVVATLNTNIFTPVNPRSVTKTVFTDLNVIRVGPLPAPSQGGSSAKEGQGQGVTSTVTVLLSKCDAEFMDWFLTNAALRYELLSYKDYGTAPPEADPRCPQGTTTIVGPGQIEARYGFTRA